MGVLRLFFLLSYLCVGGDGGSVGRLVVGDYFFVSGAGKGVLVFSLLLGGRRLRLVADDGGDRLLS